MATATHPVPRLAYSPREAAEAIGLSVTTVRYMVRVGTIPAARIGRRVLISQETLERLIAEGAPL